MSVDSIKASDTDTYFSISLSSQLLMSLPISSILHDIVILDKLTFWNAHSLSGHAILATFSMQSLTILLLKMVFLALQFHKLPHS